MASFATAKVLVNSGAIATVTGFVSTGLLYAGKKAVALETKACEASKSGGLKNAASAHRSYGLSFAPQYDGLHFFETVVSKASSS